MYVHFFHVKHDIVHLLFSCIKTREVWKHVGTVLETNITLYEVIGITAIDSHFDWFITFLLFCIYMEWLCSYTDLNTWCNISVARYVKLCVKIQIDIYECLGKKYVGFVECMKKYMPDDETSQSIKTQYVCAF